MVTVGSCLSGDGDDRSLPVLGATRHGCAAIAAGDGETALELLSNNAYVIAVLDRALRKGRLR
nr:hypothetical protein [Nocardia cyriacigeorgica]